MQGILNGLKYLHLQDFIHRDIKPGNIVLEDPKDLSSVRIIDFGLAERLEMRTLHQSDENCGTLIYQPPEQAITRSYGKPADIWACGFTMYELLTAKHPIWTRGVSKDAYKEMLQEFKVEQLFEQTSLSPHAQSLISRLCHLQVNYRYQA